MRAQDLLWRWMAVLFMAFASISVLAAENMPDEALLKSISSRGVSPDALRAGMPQTMTGGYQSPNQLGIPQQELLRMQDTAKPLPPEPPGEFQQLVAQSLGVELPIFGLELFTRAPTTFAPVDRVPVTADYVIGPGDEIMIRVWGKVTMDLKAPVDRNGAIFIPEVGNVSVAGVRYQDLNDRLTKAMSQVLRNFELNASLGQLRSIQIFVVGQARRPGSYTISSLSTLVNALFVSGGPSSKGSMRQIQVKRGNRVVTTFDLYDLIINGDKSRDAQLLPGDVIYIPPVGRQVAISGSIKVPAIYEIKAKSTLGDLVEWAGGLTTNASGQKVTVERIINRNARKVDEFNLDKEKSVALRDGDLVNVYTLSPRVDNAVTLRGNVAQPMRFPWREGMRISDIIPDKNALIVPEFWVNKSIVAKKSSDKFKSDEQAQSGENEQAVTDQKKLIDADQKKMTDFKSDEKARFGGDDQAVTGQKKLIDAIKRDSFEVNWDYAVIERMKPDLSTMLVPFNLGKAILQGDPVHNLPLQPRDVVTIFSKSDILVPESMQTKFVRLEGEFAQAGVYRVEPGESLRQLILRAGGITPSAYMYGAQLTRESTRVLQQAKIDEIASRMERDIERGASTKAASVTSPEAAAGLKAGIDNQRELVKKLKSTKATGRIVLEMDPEQNGIKALPDVALEDGDRIFIPAPPGTINVLGSVYNESAFLFKSEKRLSDYLNQAGGPTRDADESSIYVIKADGSVVSKRQSGWLTTGFTGDRMMPGDTIVVPEDFDRFSWTKELKEWAQIMYQLALGAAAFKTLR